MIIRSAGADDAAAVLEIYRPYIEDSVVSFEYEVPSIDEMASRIVTYQKNYPWLIAEQNEEVLGYAYASAFRSREAYRLIPEVSVYVSPAVKGKGVAKELYEELFAKLKEMGMVAVYAGMTTPNPETERFHEKMGFRFTAKFENIGLKNGKWHDVTFVRREL